VQATDWLPTLLAAAGTQAPERHPLDGRSLVPLLEGKPWSTRSLYWHAPLYDLRWGATPAAAVRQDHYKLIEFFGDSFDDTGQYRPGHRLELYDLKADPGETTDLSRRLPERAKGLQDDLRQFLRSVAAEVPGSNPHFDQSRLFRQTRDRADRPKP
jgi:arylsulfatase A-like enzyme